ncbi:MAG: hypothetical protein IJZ57_08240 [Clostridia bacterium]|nr:hypothetical protein [Clostridia bacterium]
MTYVFYGVLTIGAIITIISSVATFIISLFGKDKKKSVKAPISGFIIGLLIIFLLYFAGNYSKWNLDTDTKEHLLSIDSINSIQQEIIIEGLDIIEISVGNDSIEDYKDFLYYDYYAKIFEQKLSDNETFVLIMPRSSNASFDQIPRITEYENTVIIITGNKSLRISFWEKENSSETLNIILDKLSEMQVINESKT